MEIGKVISTQDGPSPTFFAFAISKGKRVQKDQFVKIGTDEGTMVAIVDNIIKTNRYYARPETVVEAENLEHLFPVDEWEFLVGEATPLGILTGGRVSRTTVPPSPGDRVNEVSGKMLSEFLHFRENGLDIGKVLHHDVKATIGLGKAFQKHLAILAMSGAGKSYLTSVIIEELLKRTRKDGRVAVVVFDIHGEYTSFAETPPARFRDFSSSATAVVKVRIPVPRLSAREIKTFTSLSSVQVAELDKVIRDMKGGLYDFRELAQEVGNRKIAAKTKGALIRWLLDLHSTGLFGATEKLVTKRPGEKEEEANLTGLMKPGHAVVFDMSAQVQKRIRDFVVLWVSKELFNLRRAETIPPLVMFVEEAHNFIPEGTSHTDAPTKWFFETIAREGRKFLCSLVVVSQRPIKLSTTVLRQCNTHIIMRITNPYDLNHIGQSSEGVTSNTLKSLTSLQVGEALVVGEAVRYPVFIKVRERESWEKKFSDMEQKAREFEDLSDADKEETESVREAFM